MNYVPRNLKIIYLNLGSSIRWRIMSGNEMVDQGTKPKKSQAKAEAVARKAELKAQQPTKSGAPADVHPWRRGLRSNEAMPV